LIDFIKIHVLGINISELQNNSELNFCGEVNPNTGEMRAKKKNGKNAIPFLNAFYRDLEFTIYESGSAYISGSLHKYWNNGRNNGRHNYNNFDLNALYDVLNDIQQRFNISPEQMKINQLEIGVNFIPPYPTQEILKYCYLHSTTPFVWKHNSDEGKYIQAEHSQYIVKIYDKARHYRGKGFKVPEPEIMRFEIKYKKLEKIGRGIKTIYDLLQHGIENFIPELVSEWRKVLLYDFTINRNSKSLLNYSNPVYWQNLIDNRSNIRVPRSKLQQFINEYSENIPLQIENCIKEKGIELTKNSYGFDQSNTNECEEYFCTIKDNKIDVDNVNNGIEQNTPNSYGIDHLSIRSKPLLNDTTKERYCIVTGLNISMQKKGSNMLSITGLRYYRSTDKNIYNGLKRKFLSDYWKNTDTEKEISEIYHNIRNKVNNNKYKQQKKYPKEHLRLEL